MVFLLTCFGCLRPLDSRWLCHVQPCSWAQHVLRTGDLFVKIGVSLW